MTIVQIETNNTIDYKSLEKVVGKKLDLKELAKTRVCLANTQDGYLFIGKVDKDKLPPKEQKEELTEHTYNILDAREQHSEKTLAQLYDPDKMPQDLKEAHHQLDLAIEKCYRNKPFENDEERLEYLFGLYEEMIAKEGK